MFEGLNEDDESDDEDIQKQESNRKKTCQEYIIIHPQKSTIKIIWDNLICIGLGTNFFLIPLILSFGSATSIDPNNDLYTQTKLYEFMFDIAFAINILLNFITAY
jgi:hypothetical protein